MPPRVQVPPDIKGRVAGSVYPPARQDLSGAVNGQIRGANGGMQDLGAAALRRLGGGDSGATPGIVPPMPTGTPPNPPPILATGPNANATPWGGGPQSLGGQNIQPAVDTFHIGGNGQGGDVPVAPDPGMGSAMVTDSLPGTGGVNQAGGNTFPLVQQALQQMVPNEPSQNPVAGGVDGMVNSVDGMTKPLFQPNGSGQTPPIANAPGVGGASPGAGITPKPAFNPTGSPWQSPDAGGSSVAPKPMTGGGLFGPGSNPVLAQIRQRMLQQKPLKPNQLAGGGGMRNFGNTTTGQPNGRQMEY